MVQAYNQEALCSPHAHFPPIDTRKSIRIAFGARKYQRYHCVCARNDWHRQQYCSTVSVRNNASYIRMVCARAFESAFLGTEKKTHRTATNGIKLVQYALRRLMISKISRRNSELYCSKFFNMHTVKRICSFRTMIWWECCHIFPVQS